MREFEVVTVFSALSIDLLQILHYYTISNVNYHKSESFKTQADDRVV